MKMMHVELEAEHTNKWACDRPNEGAASEMYVPPKDLKALEGHSEDLQRPGVVAVVYITCAQLIRQSQRVEPSLMAVSARLEQ